MKNKVSNKILSLLLAILMVLSLLPASITAAETSVTVNIIASRYANDTWTLLHPTSGSTTVTVTSADGAPTLYDAMLAIDPAAETDDMFGFGTFLGLSPDLMADDMPMWLCLVDDDPVFDPDEELPDGSKVMFYYLGYEDFGEEPDWDDLEALIPATISVDILVGHYTNNAWTLLHPATNTTSVTVTATSGEPTMFDAMRAIDPAATTDTMFGIGTFFGLTPNMMSMDMPMWYCEIDGAPCFDPDEALDDGSTLMFYYMNYMDDEPTWAALEALLPAASVTVDILVGHYTDDAWELLYPTDETTSVTVTASSDAPTMFDAMRAIDPAATTDTMFGIGTFFGLAPNMMSMDMPMWYCEIDGAPCFDPDETLDDGSQLMFYYMNYMDDEPTWAELENLLSSGSVTPADTITIQAIAAKNGYDGWEILSPATVGGSTTLVLPASAETPATLYDALIALDATATLRTNNRINTFFGLSATNDNTWTGYVGTSVKNTPKTANLADGDKIIFYFYDSMATRPNWDALAALVDAPNPVRTPDQRLSDLLTTELTFDKIKGSNTTADNITMKLGTLPTKLDSNLMLQAGFNVAWSSDNTDYLADNGTLTKRPASAEAPVAVTMTATITAGPAYNADKYGTEAEAGLPKTVQIPLTVAPLTAEDESALKASVQSALAGITTDVLSLFGGDAMDPDAVTYDLQLVDPRNYGDKTVEYRSEGFWSSDSPGILDVNHMRAKVTRPAIGEADAIVTLTVTASKGGYVESKDFTLTIKAMTQAELDAAIAELDAAEAALTFDAIKKDNTAADAVTSGLQMVYRAIDNSGDISFSTTNSGEKGVKIEWATSDTGAVASYGTVTRPTAADKSATLTATLTSIRMPNLPARAVSIPVVVRKISTSAEVNSISIAPSMDFTFTSATKTYNLTAPALAETAAITVTTAETGTLIASDATSARGTLALNIALDAGQTTVVTIVTAALDSAATDTYTINITREAADATDTIIADLLAAISASYQNTASDWAAIDMSAFGMADTVAGATIVANARDAYATGTKTDLARVILTLTALGVDATNVYGGSESLYLDFVAKLGASAPAQTLETIFALTALDSGDYDDDGLVATRQSYINFLLNNKVTPAAGQAAWALSGSTPDIDTTAMAIAALAPYYDDNASVKTAVDAALAYLSAQQTADGHYGNSNATAMTIVALTALGEDPAATTGAFAKNGKSLIDGLLSFRTSDDRFGYLDSTTANALSTEQSFRALVAYKGFLLAQKNAFNVYLHGAQTGDGTALTGETDPGITPPDPSAPKRISVRVEDLFHDATLMPETVVTVSGTHLDALKAALTANGKNPDTDLTASGGLVSAILGVSGGASTGWMYALNGEIPVTLLSDTQIAEDDQLVLFFIDWYDAFFFTAFDKTTASIRTGESVSLTLTGVNPWDVMGSGGAYAPINGATIAAYDAAGNVVGTAVTTGADGKASIAFATPGTYTIRATKPGTINATSLVSPICVVTVTPASVTPPTAPPTSNIAVRFTLQGLNNSDTAETWISSKTIYVAPGTSAIDAITSALSGTGYIPGLASGYIRSITTPSGFVLSEMHNGLPYSGWLYKINSQLPTVGMDSYTVQSGDHILLYFTKDYTKDSPEVAGPSNPGGGSSSGSSSSNAKSDDTRVNVSATITGDTATATVDSNAFENALDNAIKNAQKTNNTADVALNITGTGRAPAVQVTLPANDLKAIADADRVQLTVDSPLATLTFDEKSLDSLNNAIDGQESIRFDITFVDNDTPTYSFDVIVGNESIGKFGGTATVFIPFTPQAGTDPNTITVYTLDQDNNPVPLNGAQYDAERKGFVFAISQPATVFIAAIAEEIADAFVNPFDDVAVTAWYYDAVMYMAANQFMAGTAAGQFSPDLPMTRAMLVTTLYNYEGAPASSVENPFTDVADGQWYTNAILWAYENGVVSGYGNGLFGTNDSITREQAVTILQNYAKQKGIAVAQTADLSAYADLSDISPWSLDAMKWAKANDLVSGRSATTLAPKETATRAEIAQILMQYIENILQ